jgi:hypothetical protein
MRQCPSRPRAARAPTPLLAAHLQQRNCPRFHRPRTHSFDLALPHASLAALRNRRDLAPPTHKCPRRSSSHSSSARGTPSSASTVVVPAGWFDETHPFVDPTDDAPAADDATEPGDAAPSSTVPPDDDEVNESQRLADYFGEEQSETPAPALSSRPTIPPEVERLLWLPPEPLVSPLFSLSLVVSKSWTSVGFIGGYRFQH